MLTSIPANRIRVPEGCEFLALCKPADRQHHLRICPSERCKARVAFYKACAEYAERNLVPKCNLVK